MPFFTLQLKRSVESQRLHEGYWRIIGYVQWRWKLIISLCKYHWQTLAILKIVRGIYHQWGDSSFVSIISELSHMFGQALAQWRAFSLAVARSSIGCIHFQEVGISAGAAWSALRSRIHRLYLLYQHSPIYSSWFLLRPIPVRSLLRDFHSFHSDSWRGANCSLVGIGSFARCCFAIRCSSHNASLAVWGGCDKTWWVGW